MIMNPNVAYMLIIAVMIASMAIQFWLQSTFARFSRVANSKGVSGQQVARAILDAYGLQNIAVESVPGTLSDHYDPAKKVVRLSEPNFGPASVASLAVAAHEVGHAIQDKEGYEFMRLRSSILPVARIGSAWGPWLAIGGFFVAGSLGNTLLLWGIILFAGAALFQLVTLPVEFDASRRALVILDKMNFLDKREMTGARSVLNAAALTYVAALASSLATILYYASILNGRSSD